ncbi:GDP/GTP exchange factor [Diplocarpon rosae]|nr:GDP/GTP exchange factor [Diplocarpon rosae]
MPPKKAAAVTATKKSAASTNGASSNRKTPVSATATVVTKTTITKTTKRKASDLDDEDEEAPVSAPTASKKIKPTPAEPAQNSKAVMKKVASTVSSAKSKAPAKKAAAPEKATAKRASDSESEQEEPAPKKTKAAAKAAPKKAALKKAPVRAAPKKTTKAVPKKAVTPVEDEDEEESDEEEEEEEEEEEVAEPPVMSKVVPKKAATEAAPKAAPKIALVPKKTPAPKKVVAPKQPKAKKALPVLNTPPTQVLDVFVFGEGSAGELGLGSRKGADGKKVIDVTRPRLNPFLAAEDVGVVQLSVGGMHSVALTKNNTILTWGVNDQGALGRPTPQEGKMVELPVGGNDDSDSDSDDDDDSGLNPNEATPKAVDPSHFSEGTVFASVHAGDSISFALTTTGLVYGWGTFRGNDGILGFRDGIKTAYTPLLVPELKDITKIAVGTNHVLALDKKGKVFTWGAGEQSQLARRVVSRTAAGALVPREFGLKRKKIVYIGCGDYHSFVVDDKGDVYSWGLNSFGQTGVPKEEEENDSNAISVPTLVTSLAEYDIKQIVGGAHHSLACTTDGKVLVWGRIDNCESGIELDDLPKDHIFFDESERPRYLIKPAVIPDIQGAYVATGPDTGIAVATDGKAFSWGFSSNYQTGQGTGEDITEATEIDNSAVRGKKLVWAGVGGQFGILAGIHEDTPTVNGA